MVFKVHNTSDFSTSFLLKNWETDLPEDGATFVAGGGGMFIGASLSRVPVSTFSWFTVAAEILLWTSQTSFAKYGFTVLVVAFDFTDVWCLLPAMCERSALSPIVVKAIVLLHTMHNAFRKSPFTCLTHLYSSLVNHLGLNVHFPGIFSANTLQQQNVLKNSPCDMCMSMTSHTHNCWSIWFRLAVNRSLVCFCV